MKTIFNPALSLVLMAGLLPGTALFAQQNSSPDQSETPVVESSEAADSPATQAPVVEAPVNETPAPAAPAAEPPEVTATPVPQPPRNQMSDAQAQAEANAIIEAFMAPQLRFNFSGSDWKSTLEWFAEEADLSLQLDQVPTGSFSFSDPTRAYTVDQGLDIINLTLMKRGYSLVRRGRMLHVIDLEMENADKLISEIAELVPPEYLEERSESDIVSCIFPLGSMTPDAAKEELALMIGPWGRVAVLDSARQVKVTETASKLISIRELLKSAATADTNVIEIVLQNRGADELLEIARPLLGLEPGETSNDDIRISVGLFGDRIYAAGLPGKTGLLEKIIEKADQPMTTAEAGDGAELSAPEFRTHTVNTADSSTVFDVLQTLLAGTPDARIAIDPKTNAIIAWARPETHELIQQSINEMEGSGQDFKIIDLKRLDPAQALLTINKFFGITEEGGDGPIVDGDPSTNKLWIRGTKDQIELVERLLSELEGKDSLGLGEKVRLLPYTGRAAEDALNQVRGLWPVTGRRNQIRTLTPARGSGNGGGASGGIPERRVIRPPDARTNPPSIEQPVSNEARSERSHQYQFVSEPVEGEAQVEDDSVESPSDSMRFNVGGSDIIVQFTPAGMIIASEDLEALDAFETLFDSVATPSAIQSDLPTIIWLKYIEAEVAAELISNVMGGSDTLTSAVDSVTSSFGGGIIGLLGGGGGGGETSSARSILTATGSVNIVPDARLNALIVHASATDMQMIELILEKIDRQESPEKIETMAKPALIPVIYQNASDIAEVVKSALGDRIEGAQSSGGGGRGGGGGGGQPSPQEFIAALRGGGRGGRGGGQETATSEPAKISISVDSKSNSLVVIATPQDFEMVRQLVYELDQGGQVAEEIIETYPLTGNMNPEVLKLALESILGTQAGSTSEGSTSGAAGGGPGGSGAAQTASDIQRRIEAFRALRGGGDGGRGGGPFGGRGGGPFGGGGFGRGGGGGPGGGFGRGGGGGGPGGGGPGGGGGRGGR